MVSVIIILVMVNTHHVRDTFYKNFGFDDMLIINF